MSHGDDFDRVISEQIYQAERKAWEDVAPSATPIARPCVGILCNGIHRVPKFLAKTTCYGVVAGCVPVICRFSLPPGGRMESDGGWSQFSAGTVAI